MSSNFDLHGFPFDRHRLEAPFEAAAGDIDDVLYVAGESNIRDDGTSETPHVMPHGWNLVGMSADVGQVNYPRLGEAYSRFVFRLEVERDPHFYWWAIVLPLLPIVATSWSVFWMDPKEFSSQVGVGVTAMLTVVAYRITIDSSLPPLSYMTRMDYFLLVCQIWVFGAFLMTVVVHVCHAQDSPAVRALARSVSRYCRWLPPLALVATCVLLALLPPGKSAAMNRPRSATLVSSVHYREAHASRRHSPRMRERLHYASTYVTMGKMDGFRLCLALGPLTVYLLVLAWINLSRRPFLASGARDLAALGVGVSGMVLVGPVELLLPEQAIYAYKGYVWLLLLVMYGLCVSLAALLARPRLTVYNVTLERLRPLLASAIDELDPEARWAGTSLALPKLHVEFFLESSPALKNVSLVATAEEQSFAGWRRLETALAARLRQAESPANAWGVVLALGCFLLAACVGWQVLLHPQAITSGFREMLRL